MGKIVTIYLADEETPSKQVREILNQPLDAKNEEVKKANPKTLPQANMNRGEGESQVGFGLIS